MNLWQRLFGRKASEGRGVLVVNQIDQAISTPKNYESFAKEGYQGNVIAYRSVSLVSRACAGIKWCLYQKKQGGKPTEINEHPLLTLIQRPNPLQGQSSFMESFVAFYLMSGNTYVEKVGPTPKAPPTELWCLRPDRMSIIAGIGGMPKGYLFKGVGRDITFPADIVNGDSQILHMKTFHPTDNWYGMSPIEAAMYSIDQHNEADKWNLALLQNKGTPSGALVIKADASNPMGSLAEPQFKNLQEEIRSQLQGAKNAGRVLLLEGGMDWKQMGFSASDMDWLNGKNSSARNISLAFGVPPIMLNIPGDSTFNNYGQARLSLYEDTVLPLMDSIAYEFNRSITKQFGEGLYLDYDKDSISALDERRAQKFTQYSSAGFLTVNEKRLATGHEPAEFGDVILLPQGLVTLESFQAVPEDQTPEIDPEEETPDNERDDADKPQETEDEGLEKSHNVTPKQVNVLTQRERASTWKMVNSIRSRLSQSMEADLKDDFDDQARRLEKALENISDLRLAELTAVQVLSDSENFIKTISKHTRRAMKAFADPILSAGKEFGEDYEIKTSVKFNQFVDSYIQKHTAKAVGHIEGTNIKRARKMIKDIVQQANASDDGYSSTRVAKQLRDEFEALSVSRSMTIARTEIGIASNQGSMEAAKALDIPDLEKEWVSVSDDRTRNDPGEADHLSMNGTRVGINDKFTVPPDASMDGPGDPSSDTSQIINCRCLLVFSRGGKTLIPNFETKET